MALFSPRVYMPAFLQSKLPNGQFPLDYSNHARDKQKLDKFGELKLPTFLDTSKAEVVEVELTGSIVSKVVYRMPMDEYRDISLAVIPRQKQMFVKTVWSNPWNDNHSTLDERRYAKM